MNYRRLRVGGGRYFFTVATQDRRPLLIEHHDRLWRALSQVQADHPFTVDAYVVLPDHLHMIWTLPAGDADFSTRWMLIKRRFSQGVEGGAVNASKKRKRERGIWQRRFWEHLIRDAVDLRRHLDFIHHDPVKHGCCAAPRDWRLSSFGSHVDRGVYQADWRLDDASHLLGVGNE
jgi:putative transposase